MVWPSLAQDYRFKIHSNLVGAGHKYDILRGLGRTESSSEQALEKWADGHSFFLFLLWKVTRLPEI